MLAAVVGLVAQLPVTNDAAWQLWIGRQLVGGARLYTDIIEINPPLWFWLAVPIVKIAEMLRISGNAVLIAVIGLSAALSIALVDHLKRNPSIALALVFAFFATGISATGQREQFTLIAVTPYVFLAAARADRQAIPLKLAISIGAFAALGISLKHYFVLVPLALETWLLCRQRSWIRPEFVVLCLVGIAYIVAIIVFTPDYLRVMVPMIREAYGAYDPSLRVLLSSEVLSIGAIALLGLTLLRTRSTTVEALAIAGLAFVAAFLLQGKSFRYHGLPAIGLFSIMAIVAMVERSGADARSRSATLVFAVVPLLALTTTFNHASRPDPTVKAVLCEMPRGATVLALTPYGNEAWPAVEQCGLQWASRYMFLWMVPAISRGLHPVLAQEVRRAISTDIVRYRPDLIVIARGPNSLDADVYQFVMADPAIRSQMARYKRESNAGDHAVFRKIVRPDE